MVMEEMTPEDKYFYLYLQTNPNTTQIGIYPITKKQMAFDLGYSIETVHALMDRFIQHYKLIRYNPETRELAIKNWGKDHFHKGGRPVMDCISAELKEVEDRSLIQYVAEAIRKQDVRDLYEAYCKNEEMMVIEEVNQQEDNNLYITEENEMEQTCPSGFTLHSQKDQLAMDPTIENETPLLAHSISEDVKEIIAFWDENGFGVTNINGKQQLLCWLDDSSFSQPKAVILKAMQIACANNKRRLTYVVGILKNWENESLKTVEEIEQYCENQKPDYKTRLSADAIPAGRAIPSKFVLDLTAGEES